MCTNHPVQDDTFKGQRVLTLGRSSHSIRHSRSDREKGVYVDADLIICTIHDGAQYIIKIQLIINIFKKETFGIKQDCSSFNRLNPNRQAGLRTMAAVLLTHPP